MHVLTQMVEVMLRTPRWYLEILVIFWLLCGSKPHILVWQANSSTHSTLFCVGFLWFELSLCFINTLSNRKMNAVAANVRKKMRVRQLSGSLYRSSWQRSYTSLPGEGAPPAVHLVVQRMSRLSTTCSDPSLVDHFQRNVWNQLITANILRALTTLSYMLASNYFNYTTLHCMLLRWKVTFGHWNGLEKTEMQGSVLWFNTF